MNSFDHDSLLTIGSITVSSVDSVVVSLSVVVTWEGWLGFCGDEGTGGMDFVGLDPNASFKPGALACCVGFASWLSCVFFGLKKPIKLCCPLPDVFGSDLPPDLLLLGGGTGAFSFRGRLETPFAEVLDVRSELDWDLYNSGLDGLWKGSTVFVEADSDGTGTNVSFTALVIATLFSLKVEDGLRVNMSLMLRRWVNSGMRRPDRGNRSFAEYSRCRIPFTNTPGGLTISLISTSLPSKSTFSLNIAYTGQ